MRDQQPPTTQPGRSSRPLYCKTLASASLLMILVLVFSACGSANGPSNSTANPTAQSTVPTTQATTTKSYPIKVFFSKSPLSENDFSSVYPVDRVSPTRAVGTFAIQQLIAGPTLAEQSAGYFSELGHALSGSSVCAIPDTTGSADFTLVLNKKGATDEQGTATLKFCRTITTAGIGADARIGAEIDATLKQFSSIKKVVVLTKEGHCFGDESGRDSCLN